MSLARQSFGESQPGFLFGRAAPDIKSNPALYLLSIVLLAAIYFAAGKFGLSLASVHTNVSPVWPPTGIALAAVLILGYRVWPGIFLGALLTNLLTPVPLATTFGIAIGNTIEAVIAARVLMAVGFRPSMNRARDVFKFVAVAAVCTAVSATIGNLSLYLGGASSLANFSSLWLTWWLGDLTGAVTVAPLILTWSLGTGHWLPRLRYLEATILILLLSVSGIVTFGEPSPTPVHYYPLSLLMIPFLLWAAFRLGRRGVTVAVAVISAFAIWGTSHGLGPFVTSDPNQSLMMLQLFIAFNAVTFLFLVTVIEERQLSETKRREDQRRLQANLSVTQILAESPKVGIALERILPTVGESLGLEFGCVWMPASNGQELRSVATWQKTPRPEFDAICCERTFEPGVGLPGRVWANLEPAWIHDVGQDDNFPRMPIAIKEGLRGGFAFPITFNEKFLGVIEFFSAEIRQPDEHMLAMFAGIGSQIGQFIERKRAEAKVEAASLLPQENPAPVLRVTNEGIVAFANPAAERVLGRWGVAVGSAAPEHIRKTVREVFTRGTREATELVIGDLTYSIELAPITSADYVNLYFTDITVRKEMERSVAEIARQQSALYELADRVQNAASLPEIYQAGLDAILSAVRCDRASILLLDEQNVMRFVGWRGLSDGYRQAVEGHSPWPPEESKPQPVSISNIETAELEPDLKQVILSEGIRAAAFIPLVGNGKLIGKFMTYYHQPHAFSVSEINLAMTLARQLATGIEHKRAAEALRENESRLRLATNTGNVGVWDWDIVHNRISWTDSLYEIHGVGKEDFPGTVEAFAALIHPEDQERVSKAIEESLRGDVPYQLEMRTVRPDGEVVWIYTNATVLRDNGKPVRMLGGSVDITGMKQAEQALRDSEQRYRSVIEALPAAVYTTDAAGRITMFNQAAVDFSGRTPEVGSDSWCVTWKLYHPDGTPMPHAECPMAMSLQTGDPIRGYEAVAERPDGTRVNFIPYPTPLRDGQGNLVGAINMLVDITDRKKTEETLERSERELTEFFENATEAIHWVGPDGTILRANKAELRMLGYSAEEYVGRNIAEFYVDQDQIQDILARLSKGETLEEYRAQVRSRHGKIRDVLINSSAYFENGELVHTRCFTRDITEQLQAEKALRHLAAIVETTDDAVISKDVNGIITSWNPAAERLYGYRSEEVIGKPVSILIPNDRPDEEPRILARLRRGEAIDHYETVRVAKDGRRLHVSLTVSPIHDATGQLVGASKIARDITEQKRTQEEIARLLAAERAARQDAEVASRAKDEFLATLSHELRTPLTAMLGWLTILRGHKLDKATAAHAIQTIERNAKAQAQLIEDLVDISRIVGGKLNLEVVPTELMPIVDAAIEVVRPAADAKEITIDVNYDVTVGPVAGDASRLQQIIWNLLSNAVKFTPKGGRVSLDFRRQNGFAELVISDTGIGISADFLPHVFERFRQAESTATRSHRGMGLGLAIVRHLIELHGGTVTAASDGEDRGSTFTIHLPLAPSKKRRASHQESQNTNGDNGHELKGLRILLVEDEPDARELITMVLQGSGAQVEAVDTAKGAFESLSLSAPDVLVSDIGLPLESGYDLIRKVRAMTSDTKKVPAIALTAFATENDRKLSLSAGFQAHLAKPVEPGDLLKAIMGVINGKHHWGQ